MKANEILNKIKNIVGVELSEEKIELAELQLENGTIIVSEQFEKGNSVFIKGEDGKIALPVGEYELEDGRVLFVTEEGVIDNIGEIKKTDEIEEELSIENIETELEDESEAVKVKRPKAENVNLEMKPQGTHSGFGLGSHATAGDRKKK